MKCRRCERLISDELDGALSARDGGRLADHLVVCPSCRAYKKSLELLQERAGHGEDIPMSSEYLEGFSARLRVRIAAVDGAERPRRPALRVPRWVWLAAPLATAALLVFLEIGRLGPSAGFDFPLAEGDMGAINQALIDNPDLAVDLNSLIVGSIQDDIGGISPEEVPALVDDPSFWDNLSEDEAEAIDGEIRKEIKS
jgi:hypothetical protein